MLRDLLRTEGYKAGRKHIRTLMAKMGIEALYRRPNTSRAHPAHPVYPYLLRGSSPSWTGTAAKCSPGACRSRWTPSSASRRCTTPSLATGYEFTELLKSHDIRISMDGRGRWLDNVFIERLWRSVKHEEVYLKA